MATFRPLPPVPPLPAGLVELARWLELIRNNTNTPGGSGGSDYLNVKLSPYNAVGDGVADDTAAVNKALADGNTQGKTVFLPSGTYLITSGLVMGNTKTSFAQWDNRVALLGAGSSNTRILMNSGAYAALTVGGAGAVRYLRIEGLFFQGPGPLDSTSSASTGTGISARGLSYFTLADIGMIGFGTGMRVTDTISGLFESVTVQDCLYGGYFVGAGYASPNALNWTNCKFGGCANYGLYLDGAAGCSFVGGSVEGCGVTGTDAVKGGMIVVMGTDGADAISVTGTYFEGNSGLGDVYLNYANNSGSAAITGCTFNRYSNIVYTPFNIRVNVGAGKQARVGVTGCGFSGFNSYSPSSSRPYIQAYGTDVQVSWSGCYFQSPVELPAIPNYIAGGTGAGNLMRVIFAGGSGTGTVAPTTTGAPVSGPSQWLEITTDAIQASGYTGIWVQGWPAP